MSIRQRVEEAVILDNLGRKDGAFLSALVAVAATSRLRYPHSVISKKDPTKKMGDAESFQLFLTDEVETIYGKGMRLYHNSPCFNPITGKIENMTASKILYTYVRCALAHEGQVGSNVELRNEPGIFLSTSFEQTSNKFVFSSTWFSRLLRVVLFAKENNGCFDMECKTCKITASVTFPLNGDVIKHAELNCVHMLLCRNDEALTVP